MGSDGHQGGIDGVDLWCGGAQCIKSLTLSYEIR